jgi:hypothetical protein
MNRQWSIEDEEVKVALQGVIKSGIGSYYKIVDNKCKTFQASQALQDLGMCAGIAARLLAQFPLPVIPFVHNRNRTVLTEEQLVARREKMVQREIARAKRAEAIAMKKIQAADSFTVLDSRPSVDTDTVTLIQADPDEQKEAESAKDMRRYQIEKTSSGYYGVYDCVSNNTRLTGRTRQSALDEIELMREHSEVFHWTTTRHRAEME